MCSSTEPATCAAKSEHATSTNGSFSRRQDVQFHLLAHSSILAYTIGQAFSGWQGLWMVGTTVTRRALSVASESLAPPAQRSLVVGARLQWSVSRSLWVSSGPPTSSAPVSGRICGKPVACLLTKRLCGHVWQIRSVSSRPTSAAHAVLLPDYAPHCSVGLCPGAMPGLQAMHSPVSPEQDAQRRCNSCPSCRVFPLFPFPHVQQTLRISCCRKSGALSESR